MEIQLGADPPGCGKVESLCMNRDRFCFSIFLFEMKSLAVARNKYSVNCFISVLLSE